MVHTTIVNAAGSIGGEMEEAVGQEREEYMETQALVGLHHSIQMSW
jgi:hypothetical protein